jgi:hypothetical protein
MGKVCTMYTSTLYSEVVLQTLELFSKAMAARPYFPAGSAYSSLDHDPGLKAPVPVSGFNQERVQTQEGDLTGGWPLPVAAPGFARWRAAKAAR